MAFCSHCGVYIAEGIEICPSCGRKIIDNTAPEPEKNYTGGAAAQAQATDKTERQARAGASAQASDMPKQGEYHYSYHTGEAHGRKSRTGSRSGTYSQADEGPARYWENVYRQRKPKSSHARYAPGGSGVFDSEEAANKYLALLCYCGPLFLIPYFMRPDSAFIKFHANQGLLLLLASIIVGAVSNIILFGWIAGLIGGLYVLINFFRGLSNVINMRCVELPYIGKYRLLR